VNVSVPGSTARAAKKAKNRLEVPNYGALGLRAAIEMTLPDMRATRRAVSSVES
jgi:hypothetical protein